MPIKFRGAIKRMAASGGGTLSASAGESFMVRRIFCTPSTNDTYLTVKVDQVTVAYLRVKGKSGNHVPYPVNTTGDATALRGRSILDVLEAAGHPLHIPIAEGQTLTLTRCAEAGDVCLVYDIGDAAEFTADMPNGTEAKLYRFINYGTNSAAITSATDVLIDTQNSPTEFPKFPINSVEVPSKHLIRLLGIAGCPSARGNGSANKGYTTHVKLIQERKNLFDEDLAGIPFLGVVGTTADAETYDPVSSLIGPGTNEEESPPLIFPTPMEFDAGSELNPYVTVAAGASGGIAAAGLDVAFLLEVERV